MKSLSLLRWRHEKKESNDIQVPQYESATKRTQNIMLETTKFCCKFLAFLAFNTKNAGRNIQQTETLNSRHVTRIMIPDVCIQWGYEYWSFEYRKHLNTVLLVIKNVHLCALCIRPTYKIPEKKTRWHQYSNGWAVRYSNGIGSPDHLNTRVIRYSHPQYSNILNIWGQG